MILSLYRGLTTIAAPLISHYLKKRLARGKEHPIRFPERLGQASIPRPSGKIIWLHGASVGEAISLLPLIDGIKSTHADYTVLLTTGTITSAALMKKRLPEDVIHQFIPVDRLPYVRAFLDHWQPDCAIWAESELWPNLVYETAQRHIPMALINARMSDKSLKTWRKLSGFIATLLGSFDLCLAQTNLDAERYKELGVQNVQCLGNLKYASPDLPTNQDDQKILEDSINARPLWMAASTHPGEEILIGQVHLALQQEHNDILTLIAPRHPERGQAIADELKSHGLTVALRSKGDLPTADTNIYIADTLGEMGLLYRIAPIVFIGKSMEPLGGQNPIEPARLDCALVCGPYMTNFPGVMKSFEAANAISIVSDRNGLTKEISSLLTGNEKRDALAQNAKSVAHHEAAVLDRIMTALLPLFGKGDT